MDRQEIIETPIWGLYEIGRNYHNRTGIYTDTDRNYRMYNGDQWDGAKLGGVEPVQKNFIRPIVKYKLAVLHANLYAINYSSQNYSNRAFQKEAKRYCDLLNGYARNIWERDKLDIKCRRVTKDSAINDEGIIYVNFDPEKMLLENEIIDKNDIYYGNENDDNIQKQPYILIRKRMPVVNAVELGYSLGMRAEDEENVKPDNETAEQAGDAAKEEVDDMVTIVYKMYKQSGTVHYSVATRLVTFAEDIDLGIPLYPVAHMLWEEKKGSARGEGEVRYLIPNQIEVNKTEMRRVLTVKSQAYPHKVVNTDKVMNPDALNTVGGVIKTNGQAVEDVHKIVGTIPPAQMSQDVKQLQDDLITMSQELAGAGDSATGQVDPESASGRAILAVQQANQAPMTEQKESFKNFVEDLARIWIEYLIAYSDAGLEVAEEVTDPATGEKTMQVVNIPQSALQQLKTTVRIDVTPKGVYDKFAQEQTIENLLINGFFTPERSGELRAYAEALDDDAVAPKTKILEILDKIDETRAKIAMMNAEAQLMQQQANQFLLGDEDMQSSQVSDAQLMMMYGAEEIPEEIPGEEEYEDMEAELDEEIPVEE